MTMNGLAGAEIARLTGAMEPLSPEIASLQIERLSDFHGADEKSLVFAEQHESYLSALESHAGLILVSEKAVLQTAEKVDRALIVQDARYAFAVCGRALEQLRPESSTSRVHPHASVDPSAVLGARVVVGAGAFVGAGAHLGDDVVVGPNAVIADGVEVGSRVVVQAGAVLGSKGFGYVRHATTGEYLLFPQQGSLVIEEDVEIGANATIDRGALGETRIGAGTKIDNLVHIGHNCRVGRNVIVAAQVGISGSSVIEDGAVLAGQVGISDHCHIGPGVILGGQAGVYRGKTVTGPGEVFSGTPAEPLREQMRSLARLRRLR